VSGQHYVFYTAGVNTTAVTYTASVYAKKLGSANYYVNFDPENTTIGQTAVFDLLAGTVLQVGSSMQSASIVDCGNGFYRLIATYTAAAGNRNPILYGCTSTSSRSFTGDGASGWLIFGWQVELGAFATSYIPTAASSVARSADSASMTGTNFSSWYNATAGTVVVSWAYGMATASIPTYTSAFSMTTSGYSRQIMQDLGSETWYDGTTYINTGAHIGLIPNKTSFAYSNGDNAACLNGGTVATSSSPLPVTPNEATIGNQTGTSRYVNGWIASVVYYPQRLPNATLQSLTAPDTAPTGNGLVWGDGNYLIWDTGNFLTWG
jgi:hypothetical protein